MDENTLTVLAKRLDPLITKTAAGAAQVVVAAAEGPGIDIVGNKIGLGGDAILVFHANGSPANEYATLTLACAAASSGDVILLPPQTITDSVTIPGGVTIIGVQSTILSGTIESGTSGVSTLMGVEIQSTLVVNAADLHTYHCKITATTAYRTDGAGTYRSHYDQFTSTALAQQYEKLSTFDSDEDGWTEAAAGYTRKVYCLVRNETNYPLDWVNTQGHNATGCLRCHGLYDGGAVDANTEFIWYYRPTSMTAVEGYTASAYFKEVSTGGDNPIGKPFVRIWYTDETYDETLYTASDANFDWTQVSVAVAAANAGKTIQEFQIGFVMDGTGTWGDIHRDGYIDDAQIGATTSNFEVIGSVWTKAFESSIPLWSDRAALDATTYPLRHTNDTDLANGIHHTIGTGANNAAAGNHNHDAAYAPLSHASATDNPHSVTKAQVGLGSVANIKHKIDATAAPTTGDDSADGYSVGSQWIDVTADKAYECVDSTEGAAVWNELGAGSASALADLTDVDTTTTPPTDGQVLKWDDAAEKWVPGNDETAEGGGGAPTDADYVVETANGDLSAESVLGTKVITTAAHASRQAAAKAGRLFLPNNGFYIQRDTGSAWASWGPIFPMTPPVLADFSWVNQGTATADATNGGIYLLAPAVAGDQMRILKKAAPATPYTITAWVLYHKYNVNYNLGGLCWRQSSDGKLITFDHVYNSGNGGSTFEVIQFANPTTYNAAYLNGISQYSQNLYCLRIADDGTNRICSWSVDGQHFHQLHSVSRTNYITADEVGFYTNSVNASYPAAMTLLSWKES